MVADNDKKKDMPRTAFGAGLIKTETRARPAALPRSTSEPVAKAAKPAKPAGPKAPSKKSQLASAKRLRSVTSAATALTPTLGSASMTRPGGGLLVAGGAIEADPNPYEDERAVFVGDDIEARYANRVERAAGTDATLDSGGWVPRDAKRLEVRRAGEVDTEDLQRLSYNVVALERISLRHARRMTAEDWVLVRDSFKFLRGVGCAGSPVMDAETLRAVVAGGKIEWLDLSQCPRLGDSNESLECLAECPALKHVKLDHNPWVFDNHVEALVKAAPQLESLSLVGCSNLSVFSLPHIAKLSGMKSLDLRGVPFAGGAGVVVGKISALKGLKELQLSPRRVEVCTQGPVLHDPPTGGDLAEYWAGSHLREVRSKDDEAAAAAAAAVPGWDGKSWPEDKQAGLGSLAFLTQLEKLVIHDENLSIDTFDPLNGLVNLKYLDLSGTKNFTAADLASFGLLTNLEWLDMSGPGPQSREPLRHIQHLNFLNNCPRIAHLDLSGWRGLGPDGLRHVAASTSIKSLRLGGWDIASASVDPVVAAVTNKGGPVGPPLQTLTRMTQLEALDVCDPGPATDDDMAPLAALTQLKRLRLEGWAHPGFKGAALPALTGAKGLADLSLARCKHVVDENVGAPLEEWKGMGRLDLSGTGIGKGPRVLEALGSTLELEDLDVRGTRLSRTAVMAAMSRQGKPQGLGLTSLQADEDGEVAVTHRWARVVGRCAFVRGPPSFASMIKGGMSWAGAMTNVQFLDLSACRAAFDRDSIDFVCLLSSLRCLVMRGAEFSDVDPLQPMSRLARLQSLDLSESNVTNFTLGNLSRLPRLEELRLEDCRKVSAAFVKDLKNLKHIRYINVAGTGKGGKDGDKIAAKIKKKVPKGCVVDSFSLALAQAIPEWSEAVFRVAMRRMFLDCGGAEPDPARVDFRNAVATALKTDLVVVSDADRAALEANPRLLPFFVGTAGGMWEEIREEARRLIAGKMDAGSVPSGKASSWDAFDEEERHGTGLPQRGTRFSSPAVRQAVEAGMRHFGRKPVSVASADALKAVPVTEGFLCEMLTAAVYAVQGVGSIEDEVLFAPASEGAEAASEPVLMSYGDLSNAIRSEIRAACANKQEGVNVVKTWDEVQDWSGYL